jgi:hypothetical protein
VPTIWNRVTESVDAPQRIQQRLGGGSENDTGCSDGRTDHARFDYAHSDRTRSLIAGAGNHWCSFAQAGGGRTCG